MEVTVIKNNTVTKVCLVAFFLNFVLFAVKLYVGLSSNIISIYSDAVNNLFDSLSCFATSVCFLLAAKSRSSLKSSIINKTEQLLSLALSVIVTFSGAVFLYNSLERMMYPTPVWFTMKFFYLLSITALSKLAMYFFFKIQHKKTNSEVLKMMSLDSRLDFFINLMTIATLVVSKFEFYALDSVFGILISVFIIVSGVNNLKGAIKSLVNLPDKFEMSAIEKILLQYGLNKENCSISFQFEKEKYIFLKTQENLDFDSLHNLKESISETTGMEIYLLKGSVKLK